ncbi:MAG: macro domain-containing protein, partial [Comamonas sp.]|nr:macro domain-containing protein [Comamonas sp.]
SARPAKASIENVRRALQNLAKLVKQENISSVALPRLATGVGSLPWSEVSPLIRQYLGDLGIPVIVYTTYRKGEMADEGL